MPRRLPGPTAEQDAIELHGRGVFACISPWNFPLSIFTGQIAAALAAGNALIAKAAEQTPLVAAAAVRHLLAAGIPGDVLHLLPGDGETVGAALVADPRIAGRARAGSSTNAACPPAPSMARFSRCALSRSTARAASSARCLARFFMSSDGGRIDSTRSVTRSPRPAMP